MYQPQTTGEKEKEDSDQEDFFERGRDGVADLLDEPDQASAVNEEEDGFSANYQPSSVKPKTPGIDQRNS